MLMGGDLFKREIVWVTDGRGLVQEGNCFGILMGGEMFKKGIIWVC